MKEFLTPDTTMANGMTLDLYEAVRNIRIYSTVLFSFSLFFLLWSILSVFIYTEQGFAVFGIFSFIILLSTSIMIMIDDIAFHWEILSRVGTVAACVLCSFYFGILTYGLYDVEYGWYWIIATGALCVMMLVLAGLGFYFLKKVQDLVQTRVIDIGYKIYRCQIIRERPLTKQLKSDGKMDT